MVAASVRETPRSRAHHHPHDYTRGSLLRALLRLAVPLLGGSFAMGVIFPIADLALLSRLGEAPMASVIMVNQTLWQVVMMMTMGVNFATQAQIAQAVGAGEPQRAEHIGAQSLTLGWMIAVAVAVVGWFGAEKLFDLAAPAESFVPYGGPYLRVLSLLSLGLTAGMTSRAILVGAGDTTTPLVAILVQVVTSLLAEWILIFGHLGFPPLGVTGAAIGVSLGQWAAMAVTLLALRRENAPVHLRVEKLRPDARALAAMVRMSWPAALQMIGMVASAFVFLRLAGAFGAAVQTAYSIGLRLAMILPGFSFPLATACATLVGQAVGAGDVARARRAIRVGVLVHGSVMGAFALALAVFREPILRVLTTDPEVVRVGGTYLLYLSASFAMMGFNLVVLRAMQGAGDFMMPMVISLTSTFLLSIPLAHLLVARTTLGPEGIWWGGVAGSIFTTVATAAWLATGRWAGRFARPRLDEAGHA